MNLHQISIILGLAILLVLVPSKVLGGETNAVPYNPVSAVSPAAVSSRELAAAYEHAGRKHEAAVLYEEMARTNTVARKVVAGRLVTIYAETGETNKALAWAQEVMRENPDPQVYLAAVHAKLGQFTLTQEILEREIAANTNSTRAVTLRWQLAEAYEKTGNYQKARKILGEAHVAAKGTAMESVAQKRLKETK